MIVPPGPTPRRHRNLIVVAYNSTLPKRCVRTDRTDDLVEVDELVPRMTFGGVGALLGEDRTRIKYYIRSEELNRIRQLHRVGRACVGVCVAITVAGAILRNPSVAIAGWTLTMIALGTLWLLPQPLGIAAVWGNQVFLQRVPPTLSSEILTTVPRQAPDFTYSRRP